MGATVKQNKSAVLKGYQCRAVIIIGSQPSALDLQLLIRTLEDAGFLT